MLRIVQVSSGDGPAWDAYVRHHPESTPYHLAGWRDVIRDTFGHETFYLMALQGATAVGVLPLVLIKSLLFGRFLVSLPFFDYGGVVADHPTVERALTEEAIWIGGRERAVHIEFRHSEDKGLGLISKTHKVSMRLNLPKDATQLWNAFKSKLRSQIRRPQKEGLVARVGGPEELDSFYQVFAVNMRDLGTPVYPKQFFRRILERFPDMTRICTTFWREKPVAAGFLVSFKTQMHIQWASSLRPYNSLGPNMLLYWTILRYACESGHEVFDFGRSTHHGGTYRFKEQWGARPVQLCWQYWLRNGNPLPELNPQNPKYQRAIRIWQRMPVGLANLLGPRIVRYVP